MEGLGVLLIAALVAHLMVKGSTVRTAMWDKYKDILGPLLPPSPKATETYNKLVLHYSWNGAKETLTVQEGKETTDFTLESQHPSYGTAIAKLNFKPFEVEQNVLQDKLMGELRRQISKKAQLKKK